jgi:ABC-type glycerol-3-phosphate transport system substrate-binding protein
VALRGLLDEFQKTHPNIKVVHDNFNDTATYNDVNTKLKQSAQTNSLPNIAVGYQNWVPSFVDAKVALGLTQYISGPYGLSAKELADYRPQMMARNVFPQYNNEIYTWVFGNSGPVLYYNEDLLKASGAKVPDPTWTWDDLVEASKLVTTKSNGASVGLLFAPKSVSEIIAGIYSRGGKVYDYQANKMVLTDKPAVDHLSMLYNGVKEGYFATADPNVAFDDQGSFEKGKSAFYISSTSSRSFIASDMAKTGAKQFSWNATVIPHGQGLQPLTTLYGGSTLAFKGKSADEDNATWEVMKYMGSAAFQAKWASNSGYVPATKSTIDDPIYKAFLDKAPQNKIPLVVFEYAKAAEPRIGAWDQIRTLFDNNVFALFQNANGNPADTLKKIEDDSNKLLATTK